MGLKPKRYFHRRYMPENQPVKGHSMFHRVITAPLRRLFLCCPPEDEEPFEPKPQPTTSPEADWHGTVTRQPPCPVEKTSPKHLFRSKVVPLQEKSSLPRHRQLPEPYPPRAEYNIPTRSTASKRKQGNSKATGPKTNNSHAFRGAPSKRLNPRCCSPEQQVSSLEAVQAPQKSNKSSKSKARGRKTRNNKVLPLANPAPEPPPYQSHRKPSSAKAVLKSKMPGKGRGKHLKKKPMPARNNAGKHAGIIEVKPAPKEMQYTSPPPRKFQQYADPANFICRPLPPLPRSVAGPQTPDTPKAKPPPSNLQNSKQKRHHVPQPYIPSRRQTVFSITCNGLTRSLKCSVYKQDDFTEVKANGKPIILGQGTFGQVSLMRLRGSGRPLVAIKRFDSDLVEEADVWREMKAMQVVQDHWAFPRLHGLIETQRLPAVVLEFIGDSKSLHNLTVKDALRSKPHMPLKYNWVWIASDIARGLSHIHSSGYLHCDLKSNNALLWHDGKMWRAKIIDMGKACRQDEARGAMYLSKSEQRENFRRFPHVPREVIAGEGGYTIEGDVYSLGHLLLQIAGVSTLRLKMERLGSRCYAARPQARPSLASIIQDLTSLGVNGC